MASSFTPYGWAVSIWVLISSFQYGYHISALNQIQAVLTCHYHATATDLDDRLPTCIPMSDFTFSIVTAVFTLGGLLGSILANQAMQAYGRKGATTVSALFTALGAALMGLSPNVTLLVVGRFLVGVGSGIGLCVVPLFLSEIAPSKIKGNIGVLTQLSVVFGIFFTQALGLRLATPATWRYVLLASAGLGIAHAIASRAIVESPVVLRDRERGGVGGVAGEWKAVERRLWGAPRPMTPPLDIEDPLLRHSREDEQERDRDEEEEDDHLRGSTHIAPVSVAHLFSAPELRKPLLIVCLAMLSQQVSGINAVLYYSNAILGKALPELGPYVSLAITIVNVIMTFPPIFLIDRIGRRRLLVISGTGIIVSLVVVGIGLNSGLVALSSVAILSFVMSFAIGLGPVPFVMISEVSPFHAVSALSSVGLALNWMANFTVGLVFLPLRNAIAGGDSRKEGWVFFVFAVVVGCSLGGLSRVYR